MLFKKLNINLTLKMPRKYDFLLHFSVLTLIAFGTLMIVSTNVGNSVMDPLVLVKVITKQMMYIVASYLLLTFFANNFTMRRAQKLIPYLGIVLIIALFATQFWASEGGSKAWLRFEIPKLGQVTLQPAEFAKVFMVVVMGVQIEVVGNRNCDFWSIVRMPVFFFTIFVVAIIFQFDLGAILILTLMTSCCFLIPTHKRIRQQQQWLKILFVVGAILAIFFMSAPGIKLLENMPFLGHIGVRFENAQNPFNEVQGDGYQLINGLYGIARSNFWGVGLGYSVQKYGFLTQSDNDYILSIIIEELGIFGLLIVIIGYFLILQRLFYYAFHTQSEGYKIILIGTGLYIFFHFFLNVGGISGLIPSTGVPLLFISSGGSSLMSVMIAIGISQAIIARIRRQGVANKKEPQGVGGSLRKGRGETKIGG